MISTAFDDCDCADALLQIRGHPFTIPQTPLLHSTDTLARLSGYPRRCRRKTADFRCGQSADFVKFLVTSTVAITDFLLFLLLDGRRLA